MNRSKVVDGRDKPGHDGAGRSKSGHGTVSAVLLLIAGSAVLRIAFAAALGLGVDESYMIASGRVLSLGYFDHPPAAWWLSWAAAHLAGAETPVVVRLPFIALFALSTWLMYRLGAMTADVRAGFWAAALFNLSPVFGVTTATWVLPDGPLDCALLGAAVCLIHALPDRRGAIAWWCGAGLCAGLALFSKYSAVLTLGGVGLFLLSSRDMRGWLRRPEPYVAAALALLVFAPVIAWNGAHGWASFAFQGARAGGSRLHPAAPFGTLAGEALFVLPWIWLPMMLLWIAALRRGPAEWRRWLLSCLAAPPIVVFALVSLWSGQRVLFHWAAPGYLFLFPLLGEAVAARIGVAAVRRAIVGTSVLVIAGVAVISVQTRLGVLSPAFAALGVRDPTPEGMDWTSLRSDLAGRGLLRGGTVVGVPNWRDAGKVAFALGPDVTVVCLNHDARQFGIAFPPERYIGKDFLILVPDHADRAVQELGPYFAVFEALPPSPIALNGEVLRVVGVFLGHDLRPGM